MDRSDEQTPHRLKRLILPSGKSIEVIHFGAQPAPVEEGELHRCPGCDSDLVYPTQWSEKAEAAWEVTLRCPECEHVRDGVFSQRSVDAFDEELEVAADALAADLRRLTHANMAAEGARFFAALAADAILPEDF